MHELVAQVVNRVLPTRCPEVALFVNVHLCVTIDRGHQYKGTDVELTSVD